MKQSVNMDMRTKKKKFMYKKFGHFKSLVLLVMQRILFLNTIDKYKQNIYFLKKQPEVDMFEYYYKTTDIWSQERQIILYEKQIRWISEK